MGLSVEVGGFRRTPKAKKLFICDRSTVLQSATHKKAKIAHCISDREYTVNYVRLQILCPHERKMMLKWAPPCCSSRTHKRMGLGGGYTSCRLLWSLKSAGVSHLYCSVTPQHTYHDSLSTFLCTSYFSPEISSFHFYLSNPLYISLHTTLLLSPSSSIYFWAFISTTCKPSN